MYQVFVGIDVSKNSFMACAIDQGRKKLFEISTSMDRKGFEELSRCLLKFQKDSILVGGKPFACYHVNLFVFLAKEGYHTVVINPLLISNKGNGDITAIHFLAEIRNIRRFDNYKKLIAYAGLDPAVHQYGNYVGQSGISKRGNRLR